MLGESIFAAQLPTLGIMISSKYGTDRHCHDSAQYADLRSPNKIYLLRVKIADLLTVSVPSLSLVKAYRHFLPPVRLVQV